MATTEKIRIINRLGLQLKAAAQLVKTASGFKRQTLIKSHHFLNGSAIPRGVMFSQERIDQRVFTKIPIRYLVVNNEKGSEIRFEHHKEIKVSYSINISLGGMYLVTKEALTVGSFLRLHIFLPATSLFISTIARVVWADKAGAGIGFVGMKDEGVNALKDFIKQFD